mmetsp:Transcript_68186/g.173139  ORF Transcript_68186/g.173139 Transcript_68186/m.173139 type:complete len:325 (-) Transcript_68186:163-1137(-)
MNEGVYASALLLGNRIGHQGLRRNRARVVHRQRRRLLGLRAWLKRHPLGLVLHPSGAAPSPSSRLARLGPAPRLLGGAGAEAELGPGLAGAEVDEDVPTARGQFRGVGEGEGAAGRLLGLAAGGRGPVLQHIPGPNLEEASLPAGRLRQCAGDGACKPQGLRAPLLQQTPRRQRLQLNALKKTSRYHRLQLNDLARRKAVAETVTTHLLLRLLLLLLLRLLPSIKHRIPRDDSIREPLVLVLCGRHRRRVGSWWLRNPDRGHQVQQVEIDPERNAARIEDSRQCGDKRWPQKQRWSLAERQLRQAHVIVMRPWSHPHKGTITNA